MTNDLVEFATDTDVFLLIGTNTSECHPIIAMQMQRGLQRGAKMIVVDPKRTDMAKKSRYLSANPDRSEYQNAKYDDARHNRRKFAR